MSEQQFYTVKQVKDLLFNGALSITSVYVMVRRGEIPSVKYLNKRLIPGKWVRDELRKATEYK
ncbi:hypothetical protein [Schwartzia succinivorans]|uniref:hypothetical protein n=1 Tax=Schwartzia succinivorans TaxID=55507 RepID=UPI00235439C0|nr:hypothetical protein [Schwartzia succinivorans]